MKPFGIIVSLLFFTYTLWGQDSSFAEANTYYKEGNYKKAIASYQKLLKEDKQAATLYYNLANAYFKDGALADALLNYERAYRLEPSDKDIRANLAFANTQVADKIKAPRRYFFTKWIHSLIAQFHSNTWAYLGIACWALLFLSFTCFIRTSSERKRKIFFSLSLLSLFIASFGFYAAYSQYTTTESDTYAIVFAQNITIKSTPSNNGTDLFILHEGTKVKILDKVGSWHKIQLADEREGWLPAKEIVKI